jgi:hypothetical protein
MDPREDVNIAGNMASLPLVEIHADILNRGWAKNAPAKRSENER